MGQVASVRKQAGVDRIDYTPVSAVTAGDVVVLGTMLGIAEVDIAAGVKGALATRGVFLMPKDTSNLSAVGTAVYWDADGDPYGVAASAGTGCLTSTPTGNTFAGWNLETAGATTGTVKIFFLSSFGMSVTTIDALSDVGAVDYTAGSILVGDGNSFEQVAVSGDATLAANGAVAITRPFGAPATVAVGGTAQANANAVAAGFTLVTGADDTAAVKLPAAAAGKVCILKTSTASKVLKVFPNTDDAINAGNANEVYNMAATTSAMFIAYDATTWYTVPLLAS